LHLVGFLLTYPLFIAVVVVSHLCAKWQCMRILELLSTGDGQIIETLGSTGIMFVLAALKEH